MTNISLDTRVAPGSATAVVGDAAAALVAVTADDPRADPLLAAIEGGGGIDEILEALAAIGFTDLPSFGIVVGEETGLRALTRGAVRLQVEAGEPIDPSVVSSTGLVTWREVLVPGARTWALQVDEGDGARSGPLVPLDRGIVDASRLSGLVQERPAEPEPELEPEPAPAPPLEDEPDDLPAFDDTDEVDMGDLDLDEPVDEPVEPEPAPAGPVLDVVLCPDGHPSRPGDPRCITCELAIEDPTVRTIPRPPIAVLFWDTGLELPLDGPVLIGRNPGDGQMHDGEPVRALRIADPDAVLSREHLEVRPDGWDVVLVDHGSRNFTVLEVEGREPERLQAGVPVRAPIGSEVVLAESAVFRVDPPL